MKEMIKSATLNFKFKAPCPQRKEVEQLMLKYYRAKYHGTHHHVDTYFNTTHGQLKIREPKKGQSYLMQYYHSDDPKARSVTMQSQLYDKKSNMKAILTESLGIKAIVVKKRRIYTLGNLIVNIDYVENLGIYIELNAEAEIDEAEVWNLRLQCRSHQLAFKIQDYEVTSDSYSDLLLRSQRAKDVTDFQI
jgi:predicted adenylyl cyclase CyaB